MPTPPAPDPRNIREKQNAFMRRNQILGHRDPAKLIELARRNTTDAVARIVQLMQGKSFQKVTRTKANGEEVEETVPVPPAVMLRAAEILLERGWGKAPQAVLVATEEEAKQGMAAMSIQERIRVLTETMLSNESATDLEASEVTERTDDAIEVRALPAPAEQVAANPADLI